MKFESLFDPPLRSSGSHYVTHMESDRIVHFSFGNLGLFGTIRNIEASIENFESYHNDQEWLVSDSIFGWSESVEGYHVEGVLNSWTKKSCPPDADRFSTWKVESRIRSSFATTAERSVVLVYSYEELMWPLGEFESGRCSGTLINETTVLTAAHCITKSGGLGDPMPSDHLRVCSFGNLSTEGENVDCALVESVHVAPGWRGDGFPEHDFGVLKLQEPISGASTMSLTNQPPGRWNDSQIKNTAYPALRPGLPIDCSDINTEIGEVQIAWLISYETNSIVTKRDIRGANQYSQAILGSDVTRLAQILRFKADGGGGHSGSPIYLCPGLDCNSNPEIIGIWTNWNPILQKREGPRVGQFRDFVNNLL